MTIPLPSDKPSEARVTTNQPPVPGRYRPDAGPGFVTLDVTSLVDNNTHDVLDLLMNEFFEPFMTLTVGESIAEDGHVPDRLEFEELKQQLVERLSTRASMTGPQAWRIGSRLAVLGAQLSGETRAISDAVMTAAMREEPTEGGAA